MADINQAANWMQRGLKVKRPGDKDLFYCPGRNQTIALSFIDPESGAKGIAHVFIDDLLADDWEVANG